MKMRMNIIEVMIVVILPALLSLVTNTLSFDYLFYFYTSIALLLSLYDIEALHKSEYGQVVYNRSEAICDFRCQMMWILIQIGFYIAVKFAGLSIFYYAITNAMILLIFIKQRVMFTVYEKGVTYKGRFYKFQELNEGYLVKNYKSKYEIHVSRNTLIIDADELALTKRLG